MMRHFLQELEELQNKLLEMGGLVESSIHGSVLVLAERRAQYADRVRQNEMRINQLEIEIDEFATRLLALQQPTATDLRLITAVIKINTDLERMGDLAANIAQQTLELIERSAIIASIGIHRMAVLAEGMVRKCLDAFLRREPELARAVLVSDEEVDKLRTSVYSESIDFMQQDSARIAEGVSIILISRHLERIADHATNIAEDTLFLVKGVDVRHHAET